jgi:serine/threonine-protein kinase
LDGVLHFDLAPDGQRFAVFPLPESQRDEQNPFHITFLLNFSDEMRRRMPVK